MVVSCADRWIPKSTRKWNERKRAHTHIHDGTFSVKLSFSLALSLSLARNCTVKKSAIDRRYSMKYEERYEMNSIEQHPRQRPNRKRPIEEHAREWRISKLKRGKTKLKWENLSRWHEAKWLQADLNTQKITESNKPKWEKFYTLTSVIISGLLILFWLLFRHFCPKMCMILTEKHFFFLLFVGRDTKL